MAKPVQNMGASVRARLLTLAKERNQPFDLLLTRYVLERLLYRLSISKHRDRFVLKGAMLLTAWFDDPLRPTRDIHLLGFGDPEPQGIITVLKELSQIKLDDGVVYDAGAFEVERNREDLEYGGLRIKTSASVDSARVRVVIDIGFGDAVEATNLELPVLLDLPKPRLHAYPPETVVAEKFHAMVLFGRANSRMKDLHDLLLLSRAYAFKDDRLARAIAATFARRKTEISGRATRRADAGLRGGQG
ncbi:nucleotidyl transferase AbiEii/AbiGii toxin family protein [Bradyrhizobium sp.]|uniref:nucleotidyl transferase AbiEii/AbiGii toxin family protein n=1 Tax=Bradyrhizobium sp. TaxID=376 RepID=UPI002D545958|nr:nucleotidyl transferase AbiEii/AbiGii toxin family protein [Bradyrhizobium sp.]HZR74292.1 nucleotidyl transferase AbiEii/AbiGii toxin family protein [Bradyrhizobium sp.]